MRVGGRCVARLVALCKPYQVYCVPGIIVANRIRVTGSTCDTFFYFQMKYIFFRYICFSRYILFRVTLFIYFSFAVGSPRSGVICFRALFAFCILSMLPGRTLALMMLLFTRRCEDFNEGLCCQRFNGVSSRVCAQGYPGTQPFCFGHTRVGTDHIRVGIGIPQVTFG